MKKIILTTASLFLTLALSAQIEIDHNGTDVAGTTVDVVIDTDLCNASADPYWAAHFIVTNNTGADGLWRIRRVKIDVPAGWSDEICWPPQCYLPNNVETYTTPFSHSPTVVNGTSDAIASGTTYEADMKPQVYPNFSVPGTATYKYYIVDKDTDEHLDSVTVRFSYGVLDVASETKVELSIAPNPANEFVTITIEGTDAATVKMVDLLGNVVYNKQLTTTTKLPVADFKNGVYFVTIDSGSKKSITKKLIIRH